MNVPSAAQVPLRGRKVPVVGAYATASFTSRTRGARHGPSCCHRPVRYRTSWGRGEQAGG
jgi:hypothetical protein